MKNLVEFILESMVKEFEVSLSHLSSLCTNLSFLETDIEQEIADFANQVLRVNTLNV